MPLRSIKLGLGFKLMMPTLPSHIGESILIMSLFVLIFLFCSYSNGFYVNKCDETALYYAKIASRISVTEYHKLGAQPIMESDRITDTTEMKVRLVTKSYPFLF